MTRTDVSSMNKTDYAHTRPRSQTKVNHSVERRCSCAGVFPRHRHVLRHLGIWLQEGGKTQQGHGEQGGGGEREGGRGRWATSRCRRGNLLWHGGRQREQSQVVRWACANNTGWGGISGGNQEQQCKVSVVVGGKNRTPLWLSQSVQAAAVRQSEAQQAEPEWGGQRSPDMTQGSFSDPLYLFQSSTWGGGGPLGTEINKKT